MIHTILAFPHIVAEHLFLAYVVLSIGMLVEGEIALLLAGIFLHLRVFHFLPTISIVILVALFKTFFAHRVGLFLKEKYPDSGFFRGVTRRVEALLPHFTEKPFWSLFAARFLTFGMHFFSLMFSGYRQVPLKKVFEAETVSLVVWAPVMLSIGYFFSYTALSISHDIRKFFIIVLIFILGYVILEKVLREIFSFFSFK